MKYRIHIKRQPHSALYVRVYRLCVCGWCSCCFTCIDLPEDIAEILDEKLRKLDNVLQQEVSVYSVFVCVCVRTRMCVCAFACVCVHTPTCVCVCVLMI